MKNETLYCNGKPISAADGMRFVTERGNNPGRLEFTALTSVFAGDEISLFSGKICIFRGKVFSVAHKDKRYIATAYDLLRYFKNESTFVYENKTAGEVLRLLCLYSGLPIDRIADTKMKISSQIDDVRSLFSIMDSALTLTASAGFGEYVLFDSGGAVSLLPAESIASGISIMSAECCEYCVTEDIDSGFYNSVRLYETVYEGRKSHIYENTESIGKYGRIVYSDILTPAENGNIVARNILNTYSSPRVTVDCKTPYDIPQLRAGASVFADHVGGRKMICERVEHIYGHLHNEMKLKLSSL